MIAGGKDRGVACILPAATSRTVSSSWAPTTRIAEPPTPTFARVLRDPFAEPAQVGDVQKAL